jgi:hypothetical protein
MSYLDEFKTCRPGDKSQASSMRAAISDRRATAHDCLRRSSANRMQCVGVVIAI